MKTQFKKALRFLTQKTVLFAFLFLLTCIGVASSRVGGNSPRTPTATLTATTKATSSIGLKLPFSTEWAAPAGAPTAPGDRFPIKFSTSQETVDPEVPVISGWSDTAKPDESFTLSGIRLTTRSGTEVGSDTTVWLWADTPSGGVLKQAKIWNVSNSTLTALVPNDVPFGMYMVWVENSVGASAPICLNRATLTWLGPLGATVQPGGTKRIFGKNLSTGHGTTTAYVYLQPAAGGAFTPLKVKVVEPYAVEFTVPAGTATGSYKVYLHNGHGGQYGWDKPLDLTVETAWVRGDSEIVVNASGSDDTAAIQSAINKQNGLANGGTVRLKSGTYTITAPLFLTSNVRLVGAGKDATTIAIRLASPASTGIALEGNQIEIKDLTIRQAENPVQPTYGPIKSRFPGPLDDVKLVNVRVAADSGTPYGTIDLRARRGEVVGCEAYRMLTMSGSDIWVHNSKFYGGTYDTTEAATYTDGNNLVMERNNFQTNWPTGSNKSRNYLDFISSQELAHRVWAKRVFYTAPQYGSVERSYIAWNKTKDVAVDDNRGEMILFHGIPSKWYAQVASSSKTTLTIRTDGLIDGQSRNVDGVGAAKTVPTYLVYGVLDNQAYVVIMAGTGVGQARKVISHTPTSLTVDSPWRIQPAADSKIVLTFLSRDHIVYKNNLHAFPYGYKLSYSASQGVAFDGNCWGCVSEGNTSHRTYSARTFGGYSTGPGYWNEMRDEKAYDNYHSGMNMVVWNFNGYDALGPAILGNMLHGARLKVQESQREGSGPISMLNTQISPYEGGDINVGKNVIVGSAFENIVGTGSKVGIRADQWTQVLFRKNKMAVANNQAIANPSLPQAVLIRKNAEPIFSANIYTGAAENYTQATGSTFGAKPVALYQVAHFQGKVGQTFKDVTIPILNAGISDMTWMVSGSDPWIKASIQSGKTLQPEATGVLQIKIDTSSMTSGKHWGIVRLTTASSKDFTVGVEVELY